MEQAAKYKRGSIVKTSKTYKDTTVSVISIVDNFDNEDGLILPLKSVISVDGGDYKDTEETTLDYTWEYVEDLEDIEPFEFDYIHNIHKDRSLYKNL